MTDDAHQHDTRRAVDALNFDSPKANSTAHNGCLDPGAIGIIGKLIQETNANVKFIDMDAAKQWIQVHEALHGEVAPALTNLYKTRQSLEALVQGIHALEDLMHAFATASSARGREGLAEMPRAGVLSLPDELLAHIFYFTDDPTHISTVSKQFKVVADNTPKLWSHLSNTFPTAKLQGYLSRSKAAPITLSLKNRVQHERSCSYSLIPRPFQPDLENCFCGQRAQKRLQDFLDSVLPHQHRWTSVEVDGYPDYFITAVQALDGSSLSAFPLPILACQDRIGGHSNVTSRLSHDGAAGVGAVSLSVTNSLPASMIYEQLTRCSIHLTYAQFAVNEFSALNATLSSMSSVIHFELTAHCKTYCYIDSASSKDLSMPYLKSFSLEVHAASIRLNHFLESTLAVMDAPSLQRLSINVQQKEPTSLDWRRRSLDGGFIFYHQEGVTHEEAVQWWSPIGRFASRCPSLLSFEYKTNSRDKSVGELLHDLVKEATFLRRIALDLPPQLGPSDSEFKPWNGARYLESIKMRGCAPGYEGMRSCILAMQQRSDWHAFRELALVDPPHKFTEVELADLRSILNGKELLYKSKCT